MAPPSPGLNPCASVTLQSHVLYLNWFLYPKRASLYLKLHVKELGNERSYSRNKLGETDNI